MKQVTERALIISLGETQGKISLYGKGVHDFDLSCWIGLGGQPPKLGDTVEVTFEEGTITRVVGVEKTMEDLLRPLTPEELAAVPPLDSECLQEALRKGMEERQRESLGFRPSTRVSPLERRVRELEKRVAELEERTKQHG